ncbi:MAG: glucokinase [Armatimonadota bacterium]
MLLAGDVGGTKTDLAVFSDEAGTLTAVVEGQRESRSFPDLESLVVDFLQEHDLSITRASFGVAGPVVEGRSRITNLPWVLSEVKLEKALGLQAAHLINDVAAHAYAVPRLSDDDFHTLVEGQAIEHGTVAVIAPGTGLGEAFVTCDDGRYHAHATEGGHTDFSPTTPRQIELLEHLMQRHGHVSWERVCSGIAIPDIYEFLRAAGYAAETPEVAQEIASADDATPPISQAAFERRPPCPLCRATMELFVELLGAEAGNLALKTLANGGVYLSGGIPRRILPALQEDRFIETFYSKGRMSELLRRFPVRVVLNKRIALLGAAWYGLDQMSG